MNAVDLLTVLQARFPSAKASLTLEEGILAVHLCDQKTHAAYPFKLDGPGDLDKAPGQIADEIEALRQAQLHQVHVAVDATSQAAQHAPDAT